MRFYPVKCRVYLIAPLFLLSIFNAAQVYAQDKTSQVKGQVKSDNNDPVLGVSVILRNSKTNFTLGTSTDSSGAFSFSRVPAGGPYSFTLSAIGFEPQTLSGYNIKSDIILSLMVKMKSTAASLDQVVVVGYGTQKKKDLTGSVGSLPAKEIRDLAVPRIEQALSGRVAGVQVN